MISRLTYIIILNWNGWQDTIECLESVFCNNYDNYRVIVCDNASENDSLEKIKHWADGTIQVNNYGDQRIGEVYTSTPIKKPIKYIEYDRAQAEKNGRGEADPPLILIQTGDNLGFAGGNNVGLRYAISKDDCVYVWLLNNDTVIKEDALTSLIDKATADQSIGIIGSKLLYYYDPTRIQTLGGANGINWRKLGEYVCGGCLDDGQYLTDQELDGYVCGASMFINKKVIDDIGLFDTNFFMWAEETDFCLRAKKKEWKMWFCSNSVVWHKEGGSSGVSQEKIRLWRKSKRVSLQRFVISGYYDIRNKIYFSRKHFSISLFFILVYVFFQCCKKIVGIILFDNNKFIRIYLLLIGMYHGAISKMGRTINPVEYKL